MREIMTLLGFNRGMRVLMKAKHVLNRGFVYVFSLLLFPACCALPMFSEVTQIGVMLCNSEKCPISAFFSVKRENSFLMKTFNPIGCFYHPRYCLYEKEIKGQGFLKNIKQGDCFELYITRSLLPMDIEFCRDGSVYTFELTEDILREEAGMSTSDEKQDIVFAFEIQNGAIVLCGIYYVWSREGQTKCKNASLCTIWSKEAIND